MRSFLMQTLCEIESLPGVSIDETVDGFEVKGPGYELDVRESPAGYTYKDKNVEITMQKMTRAIVCYELLNGSAEQQLELLRNSDTGVAKELLLKLPEGKSALAFTEELSDAIRLVEEQIKYKIK
jgi:hypothetical protein